MNVILVTKIINDKTDKIFDTLGFMVGSDFNSPPDEIFHAFIKLVP